MTTTTPECIIKIKFLNATIRIKPYSKTKVFSLSPPPPPTPLEFQLSFAFVQHALSRIFRPSLRWGFLEPYFASIEPTPL